MLKFVLGRLGGLNFVGFSKFSFEISHNFLSADANLTFLKNIGYAKIYIITKKKKKKKKKKSNF